MSERHMSHVSYLPSKIALTTAATSRRGRTGGNVGGFITVVTGFWVWMTGIGSMMGPTTLGPPVTAVMPAPVGTCRREGAQSRPGSSGEQEQREIRDTATNTCGNINSGKLYFSFVAKV